MAGEACDPDSLLQAGESVLAAVRSSRAEQTLQVARQSVQSFLQHHAHTRKTGAELLQELVRAETALGEKLLASRARSEGVSLELQQLEQEVEHGLARSQMLDSEREFLRRELESLKEAELEVHALQKEVEEDTTEIIPSTSYITQLYSKVTKMTLKEDEERHLLTGVHYGRDVATPISISTRECSPCDVSSALWNLLDGEW